MPAPSKFHVAIDGFNLALPRGTGVATYARTLSHALKALDYRTDVLFGLNISRRAKPTLREILFFDRLGADEPRATGRFMSARWKEQQRARVFGHHGSVIPIGEHVDARAFADRMPAHDRILNIRDLFTAANRHYRRTRRFVEISLPDPPAIMHWTYPLPIRLRGARNIYTVHDLVPLRLPHTTLDDKALHFRLINDIVSQADAVCTVSDASLRDIVAFAPHAAGISHNLYQAVRPPEKIMKASVQAIERTLAQLHGLERDGYYLYYGSIEPKKNVGRLIEAVLSIDIARPLVIVGAMAWKSENELRLLERAVRAGRVVRLEYLPEADLMSLVRGARAVLFPSLTEGFGLPVAEAMALGTPVLTSREASLPEVVGDAGVMVDAYDTADIAEGILRLDRDDALCDRLRTQGPVQAAHFDMATYQRRLHDFYTGLMAAPKRGKTSRKDTDQ